MLYCINEKGLYCNKHKGTYCNSSVLAHTKNVKNIYVQIHYYALQFPGCDILHLWGPIFHIPLHLVQMSAQAIQKVQSIDSECGWLKSHKIKYLSV